MKQKCENKRGTTPIELLPLIALLAVIIAYVSAWSHTEAESEAEFEADNISQIYAFVPKEEAERIVSLRNERTGCRSDVETFTGVGGDFIQNIFITTRVVCPNHATGGSVDLTLREAVAYGAGSSQSFLCREGGSQC